MPTIADVARKAGVSVGVVSKVLSGKQTAITVSTATRTRITEAARTLNYVPDARARLLRAKSSPMVGVLLRGFNRTFPNELLNSMSSGMLKMGKEFLISIHHRDMATIRQAIYTFRTYRTCAVVCFQNDEVLTEEVLELLTDGAAECGPSVCVSFFEPRPDMPTVRVDVEGLVEETFRKAEADGRRAAVLAAYAGDATSRSFAACWEATDQRHASLMQRTLLIPTDDRNRFGRILAEQLDDWRSLFPLVVLCSRDSEVVTTVPLLRARGIRVPEDVALIGYGNQEIARYVTPGVTTYDVLGTLPAMGEKVIELLAQSEEGAPLETKDYRFKPPMIIRDTFRPQAEPTP